MDFFHQGERFRCFSKEVEVECREKAIFNNEKRFSTTKTNENRTLFTPASIRALAHGGVLPWCAQGSRVT